MQLPLLRTHTIEYNGTWLSTNTLLGLNRFTAAKKKAEWLLKIKPILEQAQISPVETFSIEIRYWSRLDPDNVVGVGTKALIDQLRYMGVLIQDDKRYWKGLTVHPDESFPHNTYRICLHVHSLPSVATKAVKVAKDTPKAKKVSQNAANKEKLLKTKKPKT